MAEEKSRLEKEGDGCGQTGTSAVRWLSIDDAEAGMTLARPVFATQQGVLSLTLATGTTLTANTLLQLIARGVEYIGVEDGLEDDAEAATLRRRIHRQRLEEIFGTPYDDLDPARRPLFDMLLSTGNGQ